MITSDSILITGASGLIGRSLVKLLEEKGFNNLLTPSRMFLDLTDYDDTYAYFIKKKIDYVINLAGLVGGIEFNKKYPADMLIKNMLININVLTIADLVGVKKLLNMGTSCMYPLGDRNMGEEDILQGQPEMSNEGYAIAKIASVKLCDYMREQNKNDFISVVPCNAYGDVSKKPLEHNHVISALIKKIHTAKVRGDKAINVFGTGDPVREFIHADDVSEAIIFMMDNYSGFGSVNIGTDDKIKIKYLVALICEIIGYDGKVIFDTQKMNGSMYKGIDSSKAHALGWKAKIRLEDGLRKTYKNYVESLKE